MAKLQIQRRLVAILAADIAGYTRLMEEDTDGTSPARWLAPLDSLFHRGLRFFRALVPLASGYVGVVIGSTDGVLWLLSILFFMDASASALKRKVIG